jgi:predicted short-subunit dehydrogenase-like oxidoreductase (DUF2520 family)
VRAWDAGDDALRERAERRAAEDAERLAELEARGIDLDPEARARGASDPPAGEGPPREAGGEAGEHPDPHPHDHPHRDAHGGAADAQPHDGTAHGHPHDGTAHDHPHRHGPEPGERPVVGIVGAGAVGLALGVALQRAGWPVGAVASRDPGRRDRFRGLVPDARAFAEPHALVDEVDLVVLAVPDDAVAGVAGALRLYSGQAIVHTSGLLGAEVLAPALAAGSQAGAFHPLVAFADLDRALASLHGATVAIEGDDELAAHLADMAEAIGAAPVRLAPGSKAAYHAAAVLAAGGVTALLDTIREVAAVMGLDEAGALRIYLPLLGQTVANARALGVAGALTGPATRGDAGTVAAHLAALGAGAPGALPVYRALLERSVEIAEGRRALAPEAAERLRRALAGDP